MDIPPHICQHSAAYRTKQEVPLFVDLHHDIVIEVQTFFLTEAEYCAYYFFPTANPSIDETIEMRRIHLQLTRKFVVVAVTVLDHQFVYFCRN